MCFSRAGAARPLDGQGPLVDFLDADTRRYIRRVCSQPSAKRLASCFGLALVRAHGGEIKADQHLGQGQQVYGHVAAVGAGVPGRCRRIGACRFALAALARRGLATHPLWHALPSGNVPAIWCSAPTRRLCSSGAVPCAATTTQPSFRQIGDCKMIGHRQINPRERELSRVKIGCGDAAAFLRRANESLQGGNGQHDQGCLAHARTNDSRSLGTSSRCR